MHRTLQPRDDIDCMCQEKKEEEDSPAFVDCADAPIQEFEQFVKKSKERFITAANNSVSHISTVRKK